MESSRQDVFINTVIDKFIFPKITLSLCFIFIPKAGVGLSKTGVSFYCVEDMELRGSLQCRRLEVVLKLRNALNGGGSRLR